MTGYRPTRLAIRVLRIVDRLQTWCEDHAGESAEGRQALCRVYRMIARELLEAVAEEQRALSGGDRAN